MITMATLASCSSDDDENIYVNDETVNTKDENSETLDEVVANAFAICQDSTKSICITYNGETGENNIIYFDSTDEEENVYCEPTTRGGTANGWNYGGKAKNKSEAAVLAMKLGDKLDWTKRKITIVIVNKNGTYTVYYKYN